MPIEEQDLLRDPDLQQERPYCPLCGTDLGKTPPRGGRAVGFLAAVASALLVVVLAFALVTSIEQRRLLQDSYAAVYSRNHTIEQLQAALNNAANELSDYQDSVKDERDLYQRSAEKSSYMDAHLVFVNNTSKVYHSYDCYRNNLGISTGMDKQLAHQLGYTPCDKCEDATDNAPGWKQPNNDDTQGPRAAIGGFNDGL